MTKNLLLDFFREIRHSLNRFVSILVIVAIGVAFFAGLRSSAPDMAYTMDKFYDDYNVMDVQIMSTMGLTEDDIEEISKVEGVESVQAGYFTDAFCNVNGSEMVFRLHSLPKGYNESPEDYINQLIVVEGRLPEAENEIVVEKSININTGIEIGDKLTFSSGSETAITDDALKTDTFTVVGLVQTPFYLTYEKGSSQLNSLSIDLYAYIPFDAFAYEGFYIDCFVKVAGAQELNAFDDEYERIVTEAHDRLANIGVDRAQVRGEELRAQAQEQLDEGNAQYEEGLAEFNEQIEAASQQLEDAYTQLLDGEGQLETEKQTAQLKIENAESQIASGEEQLASAQAQIANGEAQLANAQAIYDNASSQYNATMEASAEYRQELKELESMMGSISSAMSSLKSQMSTTTDSATQAQQQELLDNYQDFYDSINDEYVQLKTLNAELDNTIDTIEDSLAEAKAGLASAQEQLAEGKRQYAEGEAELAEGKKELEEGKQQMEVEIAAAEEELAAGWEEYYAGKEDYETQKADGEEQLEAAKEQLTDAKYQIEKISNGNWYVLDRNSNYGFASYKSTVDSMNAIAQLIPIFFLLVAVLVCMTTMTRMVSEERGIIGTYKALGYEDNAIAARYVLYVLAASLVGGVIGAILGTKLFPYAVYNAWAAMYCQPALKQTLHLGIMGVSILITTLAMIITAYYTCHVELTSVPAQLMRPKAPKLGKQILLERIPALWSHMNFSQKVTMRNLFRYKKRMAMTIIGIMGCGALLLAGLGMNDTISTVVANQYGKIFSYDLSVVAESEKAADNLMDELLQQDNVEGIMAIGANTMSIGFDKESESATVYVTDNIEELGNYILLQERASKKSLTLDDSGIILTEKLAEQLNVKEGDAVEVTDEMGITKNVPVIGITENYVFHYAYMSQEAYASYFYTGLDQNQLLMHLTDDADAKETLISELRSRSNVTSVVSYTELAADFNDTITAMKSIVLLIIVCAALLAFVVLYNLTNINVTERIREIATIKVLGFKGDEVAMYIYRENFLLTLMGAVIGLGFGVVLHRLIMKSIEQSNVMFGYVISPLSFIEAVVLTCAFSIVVMLYMYPKLVNIPMVESLKSVE